MSSAHPLLAELAGHLVRHGGTVRLAEPGWLARRLAALPRPVRVDAAWDLTRFAHYLATARGAPAVARALLAEIETAVGVGPEHANDDDDDDES